MSPPQNKNTRSGAALINPTHLLTEAINIAKATRGVIKNMNEAKKHLETEGWIVKGKSITLETLARFLLASSLNPKVSAESANMMLAIAHLMLTNLQDGVAQGVAQSITELLKHSVTSMRVDIQTNLERHANKLAETAQSQATIAQDMQKTQEEMAESARQAATQAKSYSQIVGTNHPSHPQSTPPLPNVTYSQLQMQNREQIKRRQVLIDFEKAKELQLKEMDEKTLNRKATDCQGHSTPYSLPGLSALLHSLYRPLLGH